MSSMVAVLAHKNEGEVTSDDGLNIEQPTAFIMKLFEMINGAPDEVIAWTPEGDAFVIGANLKTLEGETLPRFFRHSRFQSFVRQLNFYSFRKINRERTMWVYKHDLFHRDRPEDLSLLRRRTCPTVDGRRLSLARPALKKTTDSNHGTRISIESNDVKPRSNVSKNEKKRQNGSLLPVKSLEPMPKRPFLMAVRSPIAEVSHFSNPVPLTESEDSDDQDVTLLSSSESRDKAEDQAMIVLKIASQLAQHVRDPKNGSRISGLVTPTYGASRSGSISSGTLLTYDDEGEKLNYSYDHVPESRFTFTPTISNSIDDLKRTKPISNGLGKYSPLSKFVAEETTDRLMEALDIDTRMTVFTAAKVARFCMMTFPDCSDTEPGCHPIRSLLSSCQQLSNEFKLYRSALSPSTVPTITLSTYELYQRMWAHEESRLETIRSFSVFAINHMKSLLRAIHDDAISYKADNNKDIIKLERTISIWQKYGYDTM